jgi:hypothetical protein
MASMLYLPVLSKSLVVRRHLWPHKRGLPSFHCIHRSLLLEIKTSADLRPGETKSDKRRKAEALIASGNPLRIIGETYF